MTRLLTVFLPEVSLDIAALKIDDWSGGITDHYLNGPLNCSEVLDNFLINRNKKPVERPGSEIYNEDYFLNPAGNSRVGHLSYFQDILFYQVARNLYFVDGSGWNTLVGPVDSFPVLGAGTTASHMSMTEWKDHLLLTVDTYSSPRQVYLDGSSDPQVRTIGLPALASTPTCTPSSAGAVSVSYLYGFCHKITYTVGTVSHTVRGPITDATATDAAGDEITVGTPCAITAIPVLTNSTTECWDTATISVEIYRSTNGGVDRKYVGAVTNGTTTFSDTITDALLGIDIYTAGDVSDNEPPPQAKYVINADGIVWYLNCKEGSEEKAFRARQALKDQPYSCPGDIYVDVEGDITAGGVIDTFPIVFTKNKAYRFEGYVDNQGQGFTRKKIISRTVGCVSHNGIVPVLGGLYFPGPDGFYFTNGYQVQKISNHLNASYKAATTTEAFQKRIYGALDPIDQRVYWTMTSSSTETDCDELWVLDPYFGIKPESCFTTWSGGDNMTPTALAFIDNELVRADRTGYVFKHSASLYTDPIIDDGVDADLWLTTSVIYDYTSVAMSFGSEVQKKQVPKITVSAKNESNLSLLIQSINDDSAVAVDLKEIRYRNNMIWGDLDVSWGDPSIVWNYSGTILAERWFPAGSMRCVYKQVRMTNSDTIILNSDSYGQVTITAAGPTALLLDGGLTWPNDIGGYYFYLASDDYEQGYEITARTDDTLTLSDAGGLLVDGDYAWIIKGYRKGERLSLEAYTLSYEMFGEGTRGFDPAESGANA